MGFKLTKDGEGLEEFFEVEGEFKKHIQQIGDSIVDLRNANDKEHVIPDKILPAMLQEFINYVFANMEQ